MSDKNDLFTPKEIYVTRMPELQQLYMKHERSHWNVDEADMRDDVEQWKRGYITERQKMFIKMILRLFTQSDTDVCNAYVDKLIPLFRHPDVRIMLLSFANRETTHMLGYKRLNDTLGFDTEEFMSEFLEYSEMKEKHEFMIENTPLKTPAEQALYLARQVLMEGVNLFGSFAMLLSFSQNGKLPGMVSVNKWSIVEESMHVSGLVILFRKLVASFPEVVNNFFKAAIYETARKVVAMEEKFIDLCFSVGDGEKITSQEAKDYVKYICDLRMQQLGLKGQFGVNENPLPFIDSLLGHTMGNFFEITIVEYSKSSMTGEYRYPEPEPVTLKAEAVSG